MDALSVLGADLVVVERTAHVKVTPQAGADPDANALESFSDNLTGHGTQAPGDHPRGERTS
jgi:hypothetical protein